jgi:hypothetical protein
MSTVCLCTIFGWWIRLGQKEDVQCLFMYDIWEVGSSRPEGRSPIFVYVRNLEGWIRFGQKEYVQCLFMYNIWEAGSISVRRKMANVCLCTKFGKLDPSRPEGRCPMFVYTRYFGGWTRLGQKEDVQCLFIHDIWEVGPASVRRKMSTVCLRMMFRRLDPSQLKERCPIFVYVRNLGGWIRLGQKELNQCLFMHDIWEAGSVSVRRKLSNICV